MNTKNMLAIITAAVALLEAVVKAVSEANN